MQVFLTNVMSSVCLIIVHVMLIRLIGAINSEVGRVSGTKKVIGHLFLCESPTESRESSNGHNFGVKLTQLGY
jgi:hypothetical protein